MVRLTNSFSFILRTVAPYNFEMTVRKPAGWDLFTPAEIYKNNTITTALYIDDLLAGLEIKAKGTVDSTRIQVTAYSKDRLTPSQKLNLKQIVSSKLGVNDDLGEFHTVAKKDKILRHAVEDLYGMHDTQSSSLFGVAILAICLQMAPLKRSNQMMDCILRKY